MVAIWNVNDPQTQIIIKMMEKYGFEAGANWDNFVDSPHFQVEGTFTNVFDHNHNTVNVTKAVQTALNKLKCNNLTVDGKWGTATTEAINVFRKCQGYKTALGQIGTVAFKALMRI
jgi:peptidoglycan L-alanyl-D-glutamate endopeptidase CwlK